MQLLTKTFLIKKGDNLNDVGTVLKGEIGLNAYLIKDLQAENITEEYTRLTVIYQKYSSNFIEVISPKKGGIYTQNIPSSSLYAAVLFNEQLDPSTVTSAVLVDGEAVTGVALVSSSNYYSYLVELTGAGQSGFHDIRIDTSVAKKLDGSYLEYSPVAGYVIHNQASSHLGDALQPYRDRIRGEVKADVVRADKGVNLQSLLSETLRQKNIDSNSLLSFSKTRNSSTLELYFLYVEKEEPMIIDGFPLTNTYIPTAYPPNKVTLIYNSRVDDSYLTQNNYYRIYSGYLDYTDIDSSDITVFSDKRTVEIDITPYVSSPGLYTIFSPTGLKSYNGAIKNKPDHWNIYVDTYTVGGTSIIGTSSGVVSLQTNSGIAGSISDAGVLSLQLSGGLYTGLTGHTGDSTVHFTQAQISIPSSQINNFNSSVQVVVAGLSGDFIGHTGDYNNPHQVTAAQVGAPTLFQFETLSGDVDNLSGDLNTIISDISDLLGDVNILSGDIDNVSGELDSLITSLGDLSNYILRDGSRSFTSPISGVTPVLGPHLATKTYVDSIIPAAPLLENVVQYLAGASSGDNYTLTGVSGVFLDASVSGYLRISLAQYLQAIDARDFTGDLIPNTTLSYDIGSSSNYVKDIYANSGIYNNVTIEDSLIISNNTWIKGKDYAGTGEVNIARINTSNQLELNIDLNFAELEFEATEVPTTPTGESFKVFAYATGVSPNREITLYILDKQGKQIILTSLIE